MGSRPSILYLRYIAKVRVAKGRAQPATNALFLSNRAEGGTQVAPTASAIQTLFKRLSNETVIDIKPHKFRHTSPAAPSTTGST